MGHRLDLATRTHKISVSRHFLLQAPQCPFSMQKRFSRDHCCRGRSKPGCQIVQSHTRWELNTWGDFQLCLHWLLMSTVASPATAASWMPVVAMVGYGYQAGLANCHVWRFSPPACQWQPSTVDWLQWLISAGHWTYWQLTMTLSFALFVCSTSRNVRFWNVCDHCWHWWFA